MLRILVVDDEYAALTKMMTLMSEYGVSDAATNGRQALDMFRKAILQGHPYDLATIDIELPEMNGIQLLHELNERESAAGLRSYKIVVSAAGTKHNILQAAVNRCDAFIIKPVKRDLLAERLAKFGYQPRENAPCK